MKNRNTLITGIILVVLILVYVLSDRGPKTTKSIDPEQFQFDATLVQSIGIENGEDTLVFLRDGSQWELDHYPADTGRVKNLLKDLSELRVDRLITSRADNHERFELLDAAPRLWFKDSDGTLLGEMLIGKQGSNWSETLVRKPGTDEVYAAHSSLGRYKTAKKSAYWDRTITSFDVNSISSVDFKGEIDYRLHLVDGVWFMDEDSVNTGKVEDLLRPLGNMRASNFADELSTDDPVQVIQVTMLDGSVLGLSFHLIDANSSAYRVRSTQKSKLFEFSKASLNRYKKTAADLQASEAT